MVPRLRSVSYLLGFCFISFYVQNSYYVEGLASPASKKITRSRNKSGASDSSKSGGFASKTPEAPTQDNNDARAKQTVRNLFSVVSHIQNPQLYLPNWSNAASRQYTIEDGKKSSQPIIVATKDVPKGHPLTLFPIHALGLRTIHDDRRKKKKHQRDDTEFVAYDQDKDSAYFATDKQQAGMRMKLNIPLDNTQPAAGPISDRKRHVLFCMFFPEKEIETGWLGGRIKSSGSNAENASNCVTIPLPGAAPICAIVATRDIQEGEELLLGNVDVKAIEDCKSILAKDYEPELAELNGYIKMACQ